ncbi:hypothetical protein UlMin_015957 [Ulmus minor]
MIFLSLYSFSCVLMYIFLTSIIDRCSSFPIGCNGSFFQWVVLSLILVVIRYVLSLNICRDVEELMSLPLEKILLRWMNFQLKKSVYRRTVTNFSIDVKRLMLTSYNFLHPKRNKPSVLDAKDPFQTAKLVLAHADRMGCKRYLSAKDIIEGSPNLNLTFVAHKIYFLETSLDDTQISRENRVFCFWINSFGNSTYIYNSGAEVKFVLYRWVLLETIDKILPGIVNWKIANKPRIKMPFKKVENCNQVVKLRKQLKFSLANIAGNDIVQGNKKLILGNHDADILEWANTKVSNTGSQVRMDSFEGKSLSDGIFFLELHSAVQPSVVNWSVVTKDVTEEHKKMNASYIISIARKLGCSIFLLPEDITDICSICFFICAYCKIYCNTIHIFVRHFLCYLSYTIRGEILSLEKGLLYIFYKTVYVLLYDIS